MTIGELIEKIERLKVLQAREQSYGEYADPLNHEEFCEMLLIRDTEIKTEISE